MTSEASPRPPSPPPAPVSVKARAQEIEARSGTPGRGFIPKSSPPVAARTQQNTSSCESTETQFISTSPLKSTTDYLSQSPSRRCSEGDIFLRCKPRPPPVAPKQRRVSLEQASLPAVPERRSTLSRVLENTLASQANECQTETPKFASFTRAVESSKICDEFTLPEDVNKRPEGVGRRYSTGDRHRGITSFQRYNDDVFEKKQTNANTSQQASGESRVLNHCPWEHARPPEVPGTVKPSDYEVVNDSFSYVNPSFAQDDEDETEPLIYRSTLQFTPKPPDRNAVNATLQVSSPKLSTSYRAERSSSSCSDSSKSTSHLSGFYQNFQSKDTSDNSTRRKPADTQGTSLKSTSNNLQFQDLRSDQTQS
ncbi:uncharacterized protein CEXT_525081 [Caerostris extrusa]|uniref:Uncharacterized protein n=1 Tax=Caerostris extrusa TaxID=172846 RepID=A0AAV4XCA9_CAEEX|nr:uncharacterized protein CEXT_525081 [Caerostris extrusa]